MPGNRGASRGARRRVVVSFALTLAAALAIGVASDPPEADAALANQIFDSTPRGHGAVTVLGDSVLQGGLIWAPTLVDRLAENGWGPIRARAGVGYSTGYFSASTEAKTTYWIDLWRQQGWDAPNVFINLGANDSGQCNTNLQCARDAIMHLVDRIGPGHRIWWPQITRHPFFQHQADTWNLALRQIADERADFFTWDWPHVMATEGFSSGDNTHLSVSGYKRRSQIMAHEFTADVGMAHRTGGDAATASPTGSPGGMVMIGPLRVIDTRKDPGTPVGADTEIEVDVSAHVPEGTTAVAAYVSATNTAAQGFLTAYECSNGRPHASAANYTAGKTRGAVAITPISPDGKFCLYTHAEADLLVDLQAAVVPGSDDTLRFDPLDKPLRLVDTRESGRRQNIEIDAPAGAEAVAINLTAVRASSVGFLTAYPCSDEVPDVATVNYQPGDIVAGTAFLPVGPDGTICVHVFREVDVVVDLTGTFGADGELIFQPTTPTRMLDTRDGTGGWSPIQGQLQSLDIKVAPPGAKAVSGTLTQVKPVRVGFLRAWDCGPEPETSNVNGFPADVLANSVTTGISDEGRLCIFAHSATSTIFDTTGWWVP